MKKIFQFIAILTFLTPTVYAQEVVASAGETQTLTGYEVSWTIGEPVIETFSSGNTVLTQGFHQSKLIVTAIDEILFSDFELKVYPNPTSEYLIIQLNSPEKKPQYQLFDLSGKLLQNNSVTGTETRINLNEYASGTYLLKMSLDRNVPLQTFKIVKK